MTPMIAALLLTLPLAGAATAPQEAGTEEAPAVPRFEYRSGFWINLHHALYHDARPERGDRPWGPEALASATDDERAAWDDAVAYYRDEVRDRDLLFDREMVALDGWLSGLAETELPEHDDFDASLLAVLTLAAEPYRAHLWPRHDAANQEWIEELPPFVAKHGQPVADALALHFGEPWPSEPIVVDLLAYSNWAGAYTTPGHVRIQAGDARSPSRTARVEVLFHEAAHLLVAPFDCVIGDAIRAESERLGKPAPRDLWHALQFDTVGEVIRAAPFAPEDYVPYAERNGLWRRWAPYRKALDAGWRPYLAGEVERDEAVARTVRALFGAD